MSSIGQPKAPQEEEKTSIVEEKVVTSSGEVILKRYQKGRFLGKGGFARCYEFVSLETQKLYAAKIVQKESLKKSRAKQKLMSEIKIHKSLRHQGIVNFEHFFEDSANVYILLEMCSNQTLSEMVRRRKRLTDLEVQCYLVQLVSGLKYLREQKVIHRDLKLGNLFLTDKMEIKIGDFGLATKLEFDGERKRTICGTPNYIAPEVLDNRQGHSYEVDIWSLGVVVYTMLVGRPPFETADVKTTYRRIRMNSYSFPETVSLTSQSKGLITRILVTDPSKRPTLDEILANDFFHQGNSIPKLMPAATLSCPPSTTYLRQFQLNSIQSAATDRLTETVPSNSRLMSIRTDNLTNSDRLTPGQSRDAASSPFLTTDRNRVVTALSENGPIHGAPKLWVTKWVDYSSKYGLGYDLSNGTMGVFFNDSSKILLAQNGHRFYYISRPQGSKQDVVMPYFLTDYPKAIQKKVTLLQHFRSYLEGDSKEITAIFDKDTAEASPIFVKKWIKTRHAALFRLSNKVIQVLFQDHTEILLSSDTKVLTYVNKQNQRSNHLLATALESPNQEMAKRLKYTKDILAHMLGKSGTHRKQEPVELEV